MLKLHLEGGQVKEAVRFASHYQNLVFFAHALEILLHTVVEDEAELYEGASENKRLSPTDNEAVDITAADKSDVSVVAKKQPDVVTLESPGGTVTRAGIFGGVLPIVIEFLDHFEASLEVVVGCARKTEMSRWRRLFGIVGNPKMLFEVCVSFDILGIVLLTMLCRHVWLRNASKLRAHTSLCYTISSNWTNRMTMP